MADVIKSVGSGGGRDYSTIAAAVAALPSNLVTADQNWIFELYNDSEFSTNLNLTGHTTDATRCITFRAASGQGIKHASDKLSTARRYNQAKGVGIIIPGDFLQDGWVIADHYVFIEGLQFHHSGSNTTYNLIKWDGNNGRLKDCLVQDSGAQGSGRALVRINGSSGMVNVLGIERNTLQPDRVGFQIENDSGYAINCGALRTVTDGGSNRAAYERGYNSPLIRNCWSFGWSKFGRDTTAAAGSGYNATNLASGNTPGSNNQYSLTASNELESVTANSEDCRLKSGSTIKTLGTRDQTYTSDLDMLGEARSTSTPAIGPLEYAAPPASPTLSSPVGTATGKDAATAGATTDTASGTLYAVASSSATAPTASQIIAGQDHTGAAADAAGSVAVSSTGAKTIALTGITPDATRYMHLVHAGSGNSNVVSSSSFTCPTLLTTGTVSDQTGVSGAAFSWGGANPSTLRTGGIGTVSITGSGLTGSGLTVNSSTGVLSGTCGTVGTYNVVLTYTDQSTAGSEIPQTETEAFTLTISAAGPTINTQPSAQTASEGATATFSVAATGTGTLTYQWQRAEPGSGSYSNVSGATSSSYTTGTLACVTDHGASYRVNVTDSNGTTTSSTAALTVNAVTSTSRPGADVTVTGWSASTGSDLYAMVDEASPSDADYMISPTITGSTAPVTLSLQYPLATGSWLISVRLRTTSGTATARVYLLNAAGSVVGTSADQAITSTFTTYQLPITTSGVATRIRVEIVT